MSAIPYKKSNTRVEVDKDGIAYLYLFNNLIAKRNGNKIEITMAGYNTNTTRERLNGIPNVSLTQKNFTPYLNGKEIDVNAWYEFRV